MASRLNPYLNFPGNAREAMEFYHNVFGGDLRSMTYGDQGAEQPIADKIMHAMLETPSGFTLMGADAAPGTEYQPGNNIAVSLSGDSTSADELRGYWEKLSEGGTVTVPLEKQIWGDEFGMCIDRFGIAWMVNIGQSEE